MPVRLLRALAHLLLAVYPRAFRARFGAALMRDFIDASAGGQPVRNALDLLRCGLAERRASRGARARLTHPTARASLRDTFMTDIRLTLRHLLSRPASSLLVIATLAIGIGANTAIFSLVDGVLLRDMPYRNPDQLAFMWTKLDWVGVPRAWIAGPHIPLLGREVKSIEAIAAIDTGTTQLTGSGDPLMLRTGQSTTNLFDLLGVNALHGRTFADRDRGTRVVVLTHGLWRRQFGADPGIIGRTITLAAVPHEVIGVLPETFGFLVHSGGGETFRADIWTVGEWPLETMGHGSFNFAALIRAREGSDIAAVQAEVDVLGEQLDRQRYGDRGFGWRVTGLKEDLVGATRPGLLMLAVAAFATLLIVCANVAGLGLVEMSRRRREIAVRAALGAGRARLIAGHVTESLILALIAGAGGAVLAWLAIRAVTASTVVSLPRLDEVTLDWRVLLFALAVSVAAGIAAGVLPAMRASRPNLTSALRDGGRGSTTQGNRASALLIGAELALAVMLLFAAGVLLRSFAAMQRVDPGFTAEGVLMADVSLPLAKYQDEEVLRQFHRQLAERLGALPGVTAVGASNAAPLSGLADQGPVQPDAWSAGDDNDLLVDWIRSTPGYVQAMGLTLVAGRDFTWADRQDSQPVVIIDDVLARQTWPGTNPIGRTLALSAEQNAVVVGVVKQPRQYRMHEDDRPQVFLAWQQNPTLGLTLAVRTSGDPGKLAGDVRRAVAAIDPHQPIANAAPMVEIVDLAMAERRLQLTLLGAFAACAVLLASIGLYGMIASTVAQRTQEMGVRAALGATAGSIRTLVLRRALGLAGAGIVAGLAGALAIGGALSGFAYGVPARDPLTLAATVATLLAVALVAAYVPARRASRVDPIIALRDG